MTNTGGTAPGWYHAPGDAEGTQRYWDGSQWIGEPQAVQAQAAPQTPNPAAPPADDATVQYTPPAQETPPAYQAPPAQAAPGQGVPQGGAPGYGVPAGGAPGTPGAPAGYQAFGGPAAVGQLAEWGERAIAYLIDIAPMIAAYILFFIAAAISDVLGVLMLLVLFIGGLAYYIWNFILQQGQSGQTIGKQKQGIKLVSDETGQPVGAGMAFVRYLIIGLGSSFTCGIYGLLDVLWPLWDPEKKRITDKILKNSVVRA